MTSLAVVNAQMLFCCRPASVASHALPAITSIAPLQAGTSFWFYTWQDCDLIYATRQGQDKYCADASKKCGAYKGSDFGKQLTALGTAYAQFKGNNLAWQEEYARGHCKLNNIGAVYSKHKVRTRLLCTCETRCNTFFSQPPSEMKQIALSFQAVLQAVDLKQAVNIHHTGCIPYQLN